MEKITYTYCCEYCDSKFETNKEAIECCEVLRDEGLKPNY